MSARIAAQTVVAAGKCACCGGHVEVKLNKNGNAYYFCTGVDEYGQFCSHHERWGKGKSIKFAQAYLAGKAPATMAANTPAAPIATKPAANQPTPPAPKPTPEAAQKPKREPTGTYEDYVYD